MVRSRSHFATPPGATIKEQLNDRGMSQKEFAVRMDMSEKHMSKLIIQYFFCIFKELFV